jgi:hypothetical protein
MESASNKSFSKTFEFSILFDKICWIFKRRIKKIKDSYNDTNMGNQSSIAK